MLSFRLNHRRTRVLMTVAWIVAIALSAWVAAELVARAIAPARTASSLHLVTDPRLAAQRIVGRSLVASPNDTGVPAANLATARSRFALIGVATGFADAAGFALLRGDDGRVVAVQMGEQVAPGVRLSAIHADHVELERDGAREVVRMTTVVSDAIPVSPTSMFPNPTNQR